MSQPLAETIAYKGVLLSEVPGMRERITLLESQNAKLRELLRRAAEYVRHRSELEPNEALEREIRAALTEAPAPQGGKEK